MKPHEALANAAAEIAAHGANEYLKAHNLRASPEAMAESLQAWLKIQLPLALHDAMEAVDCGMVDIGVSMFTAAMLQAGIQAAKECGMPEVRPVQVIPCCVTLEVAEDVTINPGDLR